MHYGYVYKCTLSVNGKIYVGQHKSSTFNEKYFGSGVYWNKAIKKYGIENVSREVLCWCDSKKELDEKEIYYIALLNATDSSIGYNIAKGGEGGDTWSGHSEEDKKAIGAKISKVNKGKRLVILSEESKNKISNSQKLRIANRTDEQKEIESKNKSVAAKNKVMSDESIRSMVKKCIDTKRRNGTLKQTEETKQKLSDTISGRKSLYKDGEYCWAKGQDNIQKLLDDGWVIKGTPRSMSSEGRESWLEKYKIARENRSPEYRQYLKDMASKRFSGEGNPMYGSTFVWMNDGTANKRVDPDKTDYFLDLGFVLGKINFHKNKLKINNEEV